MATSPLQPIVFDQMLTTEWVELYKVPESAERIGIDAAVFNNYSDNSVSYSVRIAQVGDATEVNEIISLKDLRRYSNDLASAMIGQSLVKGGRIFAKASANDAVNVNITATLITP